MTLDKAIELLRANYKTALNLKWVRKPLAWALYQTWHEADIQQTESRQSCDGCDKCAAYCANCNRR